MLATRPRVCRNSGETQEIKTGGWFMDRKLQLWSQRQIYQECALKST
jgi:hypothetical protein